MLNGKKLKLILAMIALLLCITTVEQTYAKYVTSTTGEAAMQIARWRILVNNEDIHTGSNMVNQITPTFVESSYIAAGKIAPTSEGYFDVVIDSTNTDTSFTYTIDTSVALNSPVSDLVATGYKINEGSIINFVGSTQITGNVLIHDTIKVNIIRIYFKWDDGATARMDNNQDTNASYVTSTTPLLDVNLSFIQIAS